MNAKTADRNRPVLPADSGPASPSALRALRRFHFLGRPEERKGEPLPELVPALLHRFTTAAQLRTDYPLYLVPGPGDGSAGVCQGLPEFLSAIAPPAEKARMLVDNLPRLERQLRQALEEASGPRPVRPVLREAGRRMLNELAPSAKERESLEAEIASMVERVPEEAVFLPAGDRAALHLLMLEARGGVLAARRELAAEAGRLAGKLQAFLEADRRRREGARPDALARELGNGAHMLDAEKLSELLGPRRGTRGIDDERRQRVEKAAEALARCASQEAPELVLVHDGSAGDLDAAEFPGWRIVQDTDPCTAVECLFDEEAQALAEVLRAVRVAKLELDGNYEPARHDPVLARFDWRSFGEEELRLLTPVVALEDADRIVRRGLGCLSRLLLSGRPVQVVLLVRPVRNPGEDPEEEPASAHRLEPGYLGLSHREAVVTQSSPARPRHLLEGFRRAFAAARPALHVVASMRDGTGKEPGVGSWLYTSAAIEGRAHPFFHYDPAAGASWAKRFDLEGNPEAEKDWPVYPLACRTAEGKEEERELAFTFADFALLDPSCADQFQPVTDDVPTDDLVTVDVWAAMEPREAEGKIPFVWAVDAMGRLRRVAVTRALARAARDRLDFWRILQELAGVRSEYVTAAVDRVRQEAEARFQEEKQRLEEDHAREIERLRREAGAEAIQRLSAALLDVDPTLLGTPGGGLGALAGRSADEIAAELQRLVPPEALEEEEAGPADAGVEQVASELMRLVDPEKLETEA